MGDSVWYIASPAPAPTGIVAALTSVREALIATQVLESAEAPEAILGTPRGPVRRPGPRALAAQHPSRATLLTNGAEFCESAIFNWGQLNTDRLSCGVCGVTLHAGDNRTRQEREAFGDQLDLIGTAAAEADFADDAVPCLTCNEPTAVNDWADGDGFILAGFGIALWNWDNLPAVLDPVRQAMAQQMPQIEFAEDGYKI